MLLVVLTLGLLSFGAASSRSHMERYAEPECRPIPPRLNINNSAMLFIDHQSGLINLIGDYTPDEFKNNLLALIDGVKLAGIPVILTTSFEEGPNGPMVPELKAAFPDAPYIARPGQINAWDNSDFRDAVRDTGKHQLIVAGVVTDVCVAFPVMDALREGYDVYVVADASGTFNQQVADAALMRMNQAGASITNWFAVVCELMRDWRNDMKGLAEVLSSHLAAYKALILSYNDVEALNPLGS